MPLAKPSYRAKPGNLSPLKGNQAMIGKLSERKPRPSAVTIRRIEAAVERECELVAMWEAGR